jgi:predicted dienelactone hydrolase
MRFLLPAIGVLLLFGRASASEVGFRQLQVPDPPGKPLAAGIWYPSSGSASTQALGAFQQDVVLDGPITGKNLPAIFFSHGTAGSLASHYDTAIALARAGFIVVALTHNGDNGQDQSNTGNRVNLIDRPRQLEQIIHFVLNNWSERAHINPGKVGVFGFSLGGFTVLVESDGIPDLGRMKQLCDERPAAPECDFIRQRHGDMLQPTADAPVWAHDAKIRAAVVAAPAVAYLFGGPGGLSNVKIPVQLWRAAADRNAPDAWNSAVVAGGLPTAPDLHVVPNANHYAFLPPCTETLRQFVAFICADEPGFDRAAFHQQFNREVVVFFEKNLLAVR